MLGEDLPQRGLLSLTHEIDIKPKSVQFLKPYFIVQVARPGVRPAEHEFNNWQREH